MLIDTIALELFSHTDHWKEHGELLLHDRFFMLRGFDLRRREFLVPSQPYLLQEGRVVIVRRGEATYSFNLVEHRFQAGDLVVFHADTLIEKQGHSPDFQFDAFSFQASDEQAQDSSFTRLRLNEQTQAVVDQHIQLMWTMAHEQPFPKESLGMIVQSLLRYISAQQPDARQERPSSRRDDLLRRFIALVSRHASRERSIPYYAKELCVAPHYLSTLIKEVSGQTVMQWVNQATVKEIKVWLAYSDESAAQIADRLNFPCPSSLTKFFKRETGLTPSEYRSMRG